MSIKFNQDVKIPIIYDKRRQLIDESVFEMYIEPYDLNLLKSSALGEVIIKKLNFTWVLLEYDSDEYELKFDLNFTDWAYISQQTYNDRLMFNFLKPSKVRSRESNRPLEMNFYNVWRAIPK